MNLIDQGKADLPIRPYGYPLGELWLSPDRDLQDVAIADLVVRTDFAPGRLRLRTWNRLRPEIWMESAPPALCKQMAGKRHNDADYERYVSGNSDHMNIEIRGTSKDAFSLSSSACFIRIYTNFCRALDIPVR